MNSIRFRASLVSCLKALADDDVAANGDYLVSLWFENFYLPGVDARGYIPDAYRTALERFNSAFSGSELCALEEFHGFLADWKRTSGRDWRTLRRAAELTLEEVGVARQYRN